MKFIKLIAASLSLIMMIGLYCLLTGGNIVQAQNRTYKIGDVGPAGGWIFYDKGDYSGGWRYLEAGHEDLGRTYWGCNEKSIPGAQGTAIGTGKSNTQAIIKGCSGISAARKAADYRGGGKTDWFLPSKDELNAMYTNLRYPELDGAEDHGFSGEFSAVDYLTSSEINDKNVWAQNFRNGVQRSVAKTYYHTDFVRAARAF